MTHKVKATREGLIGHKTAAGLIIGASSIFVALPSTKALWKIVRVSGCDGERSILAPVLDIGPWNTDDDTYVFSRGDIRPQSESGTDTRGRKTNGAGIDLSDQVARNLGLDFNKGLWEVTWEFIDA